MSARRLLALICVATVVSGCSHAVPPTSSAAHPEKVRKSEAQRQALAQTQAELESQNLAEHRAKLRAVVSSDVIGLTEQQVLQQLNLDRLDSRDDGRRWFSSGIVHFPPLGGYIIESYHLLTFEDGKVIRYEVTNVPTACVITAPVRP